MFLDVRVEQLKYKAEVERVRANAERLAAMGIWVVRASQPEIDLLVVPRHTARLGLPKVSNRPIVLPGQMIEIQTVDIPALAARPLGVRLDLSGYDQRPPSVSFRDPWTWELLPYNAMPLGMLFDDPTKAQLVVLDQHPETKRPFLCIRGVREYHSHPQHDGDDWALYRSSTNVLVLIERIARVFVTAVRPNLLLQIGASNRMGQTNINLVVQWQAEPRP